MLKNIRKMSIEENKQGFPKGDFTFDESCDICGNIIHKAGTFSSSGIPEPKTACIRCMNKYIDENRIDELKAILNG